MTTIPLVTTGAPLPLGGPQRPINADIENAPTEIRRVAEEFESVFLAEMLSPMFEALNTEGLGGGGQGEQMFRPMLVAQYAESISQAGGVGIADSIVRELLRMQQQVVIEEPANGVEG